MILIRILEWLQQEVFDGIFTFYDSTSGKLHIYQVPKIIYSYLEGYGDVDVKGLSATSIITAPLWSLYAYLWDPFWFIAIFVTYAKQSWDSFIIYNDSLSDGICSGYIVMLAKLL